jgi:hypothetical protein
MVMWPDLLGKWRVSNRSHRNTNGEARIASLAIGVPITQRPAKIAGADGATREKGLTRVSPDPVRECVTISEELIEDGVPETRVIGSALSNVAL